MRLSQEGTSLALDGSDSERKAVAGGSLGVRGLHLRAGP